jgi:hypothetical protein
MFCITCTRYSIDPSKMSGVIATVGKYTKRPSD